MNCPKCGECLRDVVYEGMHIHSCDECGGEVIGPDQIRQIVRRREEILPADVAATTGVHTPTFGVPDDVHSRSLSCPSCAGPMRVTNYCGDSGVYIDRCGKCGTMFLDHEELERIQVLMETWQSEAPAKIREIADELERKRREVAESTSRAFAGSRFAFVNAIINRLLDAA